MSVSVIFFYVLLLLFSAVVLVSLLRLIPQRRRGTGIRLLTGGIVVVGGAWWSWQFRSRPESLLLSGTVTAAALVLLMNSQLLRWKTVAVPLAAVLAFCVAGWTRQPGAEDAWRKHLPRQVEDHGFVSSSACRSCHPGHYDSWHDSWHRTMTQAATSEAVMAPFEGVKVENRGRTYQFEKHGDEFWVTMPDVDWENAARDAGIDIRRIPNPPPRRRQVVMVTGSHHMQNYWVPGEQGNELFMLPLTYHLRRRRWFPSEDSFLNPPDDQPSRLLSHWNSNCIRCHSVAGNPGLVPTGPSRQDGTHGVMNSRVAELGISCEACHGPGQQHIQFHHNPLNRYLSHLRNEPDPTTVNPARVSPEISSQICGQCHSNFELTRPTEAYTHGHGYQAGGDLSRSHRVIRFEPTAEPARDQNQPVAFWGDGASCIGGDEFNGMTESACYLKGKMSCLSCHSLHQSDPDDQLAAGMRGNRACTQCHTDTRFTDQIELHTHHGAGSGGSLCYNCHMPHTSYALLTAMRSHRIDSPDLQSSVRTGRPNACNLCHLDRTMAWSAAHLTRWYAAPDVELSEDEQTISAALLWLLRGDALQRVLAAWHFGWSEARTASGSLWQIPFLAATLNDPYSAVRFTAEEALRQFPEYRDFTFDFVAPPAERIRSTEAVLDRWRSLGGRVSVGAEPALLLTPEGTVDAVDLERLTRQRNDRPVVVPE